jgi:hypothetical protein
MENKYRKFYVDWWNIRKSTIYTVTTVVILGAALSAGGWWASRHNWFIPAETSDIPTDAARIVSFEGEVRITRAATRETILVTKATYVGAGDTVQTQADGRAIIQMIDGSVYSVRPNSTVVVRDTTSLFGGKNVRVRVSDGQLNVRTEDESADTKNVVELGDSENQLRSRTDASFNASGDNGGEIRISRGGVETTLGGEKTVIGENEFATVNGNKLSPREKLLAPPRPSSPDNLEQITDPSGNGVTVNFAWQDPEGNTAASFYLQVSKSPYFASDSILVDRNGMQSREFRLAGLSPGAYYWRVKATSRSGQTTSWNEPWKFMVIRRGESPDIEAADWHVDSMGGNLFLVSGKTQPGMLVRCQGRQINAGADGAFRLQINSPSGETTVEILDDRGDRTGYVLSLQSGAVIRKF